MADPTESTASQLRLDLPSRPRALETISYNSILAGDIATSSDDELPDPVAEEAQTAIGVSIGQQQTRLTSPKTPAVEKQAAIEEAGGFFGGIDGAIDREQDDDTNAEGVRSGGVVHRRRPSEDRSRPVSSPAEISPPSSPVRLPSPWRSEARTFVRDGKSRSGLLDGVFTNRRRASSGPETWFEGWQKSFMSNLPSVPKRFSMQSPFFSTASRDGNDEGATQTSSFQKVPTIEAAARPTLVPVRSRASQLRKIASDESLITQRTLSTVESLGDDSRFEDVQGMVNSRVKAIRDSIADSSIKMPSFSRSNMTPDFLRSRASSLNSRLQSESTTRLGASTKQPVSQDPLTRQPYRNVGSAVAETTSGLAATHPNFYNATSQLEGDIVVLGGYRGSILRSAEPPHRQLWVPVKVGLNLRKADLEVGIEEGDDARATSKIIPGGMLSHIGPVDISRRLFKRLRSCENAQRDRLRVHDYGYDWRLDPT